ncbi:MAG: hypothetical protein Q9181_007823 [Wetmoreana brouardii]
MLANGWIVRYELFAIISPMTAALADLRYFYSMLAGNVDQRDSMGEIAGNRVVATLGRYSLQFIADRSYGPSVGWDVIKAFAEKMLENQFPMTFKCHVSPPESVGLGAETSWSTANEDCTSRELAGFTAIIFGQSFCINRGSELAILSRQSL